MVLNNKKILVTGAHGFLGQHVVKALKQSGVLRLFTPSSQDLDLRLLKHCQKAVHGQDVVIHIAGRVGGIGFNRNHPAEMFYDNMVMGVQLLDSAYRSGVKKFVTIGTICSYPKYTQVPFNERELWNGYPEETNAPYGIAKKALLVQGNAYREQYGFNAIYLLPVNLYGPGDNFNPLSSHVIPALIRKICNAKYHKSSHVTIWGTGNPTREFLYVDDAAEAIVKATQLYDKADPVNLGSGLEISIKELALRIASIVGYKGMLRWDSSKPDGQPRRLLNTERAYKEFGFRAKTNFTIGLRKTIQWYEKTYITC